MTDQSPSRFRPHPLLVVVAVCFILDAAIIVIAVRAAPALFALFAGGH